MSRADGREDSGNNSINKRDGNFPSRLWWQSWGGTEGGSLPRDERGVAAKDVTTIGDRCRHHCCRIDGVFDDIDSADDDDVADHRIVPLGSLLAFSTPINAWGEGGVARGCG
jgi:hypothetical protein